MNMKRSRGFCWKFTGLSALMIALLCVNSMMAQSPAARTTARTQSAEASPTPISNEDLAATREELFKLLRISPKLTGVVAYDPSLLGDQEYVSRNNPELAQFLQSHPEIVRNPDFYLFANFDRSGRRSRELSLQRAVWPEMGWREPSEIEYSMKVIIPFLIFVCVFGALLWILRVLLENRRWSRLFKAQTDIYNKLLDRFGSNEELLAYVQGTAGKRFLESVSLPLNLQSHAGPVGRILLPLQFGVVLTLAGLGLIWVRGNVPEVAAPLLIFGTLALMLGIGFVISAGLSFLLARHLDLLPQKPEGGAPLGTEDRL